MLTGIAVIAAAGALAVLGISYWCFLTGFYAKRKKVSSDEVDLPEGEIYEKHWDSMRKWILETREAPYEAVSIRSFDGLTLWGKYYEYEPGAPVELMFHGYRGSAERDLCGGMQRCFKLGHSALIVDQRCSGRSDGHVISFGINEHKDCLAWVDFAVRRFGPDVKLILTGMSMGAATVLMAGGTELPENVMGILADCGYSSPKEIIMDVIAKMGLPARLVYPFAKFGARLYGHFDLEETSPEEAVKRCSVPVIFFHGTTDDYVPSWMSRKNFEACASRKELVLVPDAGHGLCYPTAPEDYLEHVRQFFAPEAAK